MRPTARALAYFLLPATILWISSVLAAAAGAWRLHDEVLRPVGYVLAIGYLAFLIGLCLFVGIRLSKDRRLATNRCPACGYDLRATPDQCPECGQIVKGSATIGAKESHL